MLKTINSITRKQHVHRPESVTINRHACLMIQVLGTRNMAPEE